MAELVQQREHGDAAGQPQPELVLVEEHDQTEEDQEAGPNVHVEAEQAEHRPQAYGGFRLSTGGSPSVSP